MPLSNTHWTVEDLAGLPEDGNRYEIIDGELLVTPAPSIRHQRLVGALLKRLVAYLDACRVGEAFVSPADIVLARDTLVQPDVFVISRSGGPAPQSWSEVGPLLLAVEVLSPGTMRADRYRKRPRYQEAGVAECWIVDADARLVERWRPGEAMPEIERELLAWGPESGSEPLVMDLGAVFGEGEGE